MTDLTLEAWDKASKRDRWSTAHLHNLIDIATDTIDTLKAQLDAEHVKAIKLETALRRVAIQVTPEEYEEECGSEMDEMTGMEAYEAVVIDARTELIKICGDYK
jgi:hypothetical protein